MAKINLSAAWALIDEEREINEGDLSCYVDDKWEQLLLDRIDEADWDRIDAANSDFIESCYVDDYSLDLG